jgi:cytochrome b561
VAFRWLVLLLLGAGPQAASAGLLLDEELTLDLTTPVLVAMAPKPADPSLDFDLLGKPAASVVKFDDAAAKQRTSMLALHQKLGLGMFALELATTVVGQLNYNDKYATNAPVTGQYELTHAVLAFSTLGVFAVAGTVALLAPPNPVKREKYDRLTLHKASMAVATAGMVAQGALGIYANQQEGRINQAQVAQTHLVIGYVTLAAVCVAVGAIVF